MRFLDSQAEFEQLIGRGEPLPPGTELPPISIVYFTATWCGPCQRLDTAALEAATPQATWLKCDIDRNKYTAGYCGVRSIPTFMIIADKKVVGQYGHSDMNRISAWLQVKLEDIASKS